MTTYRLLEAFDPVTDSMMAYIECFHLFFEANGITFFLSTIGGKRYEILHLLVSPVCLEILKPDKLTCALVKHY